MLAKILFAGSGGQGVLTIGNVLANAAMLEDLFVTYLPAYGAAVRGGTANCTVSISDEEIASPVASSPDVVVTMNQPSTTRFINRLLPGGQIIYNSSMVHAVPVRGDLGIFPVPANKIALELGSERSANMVILGSFIRATKLIKVDTVFESIQGLMANKKKLADMSVRAVTEGYERFPFTE